MGIQRDHKLETRCQRAAHTCLVCDRHRHYGLCPNAQSEAPAVPDEKFIFSASERGYGKKTAVDQYPLKRRGGQGVLNLRITPKIGNALGMVRIINLEAKDRVCSIAKVREE